MRDFVTIQHQARILVLLVDNPPVNALGPGVPEAIAAAIDAAERNDDIDAIVLGAAGRTFVAGADISTLELAAWDNPDAAANLHGLLARIEGCCKPVVMAIHGTALGGGLELAMAGHCRVATPGAELGQPEVNLGIIPGAEGTQRLPRLVGVEKALEMCVSGRPIGAAEALSAGLIDAVIEGDLLPGAVAFATARTPGVRTPGVFRTHRTPRHPRDQRTVLRGGACIRGEDSPPSDRAIEGHPGHRSRDDAALRGRLPPRADAVLRMHPR